MSREASRHAVRIDRFFGGPGSRADQWCHLMELANAWANGTGDRAADFGRIARLDRQLPRRVRVLCRAGHRRYHRVEHVPIHIQPYVGWLSRRLVSQSWLRCERFGCSGKRLHRHPHRSVDPDVFRAPGRNRRVSGSYNSIGDGQRRPRGARSRVAEKDSRSSRRLNVPGGHGWIAGRKHEPTR